jgi:hypothetical protein
MSGKTLWMFLVIVLIVGCHRTSNDDFLSASEQIEINGRYYILETYLWRDFMPVCPPDGEPLQGVVQIIAVDSQPFPYDTISMNRVYIIKGNDIWESEFSHVGASQGTSCIYKLEGCFSGGPKWGPNTSVDVIVNVVRNDTSQSYLLMASNQMIYMTCK